MNSFYTMKKIPVYNQNLNNKQTSITYSNFGMYKNNFPKNGFLKRASSSKPSIIINQPASSLVNTNIYYDQYYPSQATPIQKFNISENFVKLSNYNNYKIKVPQKQRNEIYGNLNINNNVHKRIYSGDLNNNYLSGFSNNNTFIESTFNYPNSNTSLLTINIEPSFNFKLNEFIILKQIGKGSEGIVYAVRWKKNNKNYAMKKSEIQSLETINDMQKEIITIKNYVETTGNDGILKTFGTLCVHCSKYFKFYEIMELADRDWDKEVRRRHQSHLYYQEYELMEILRRLIKNFSSLQSNHITHRDIKPQNIMIINGTFKICDFGNAKILKKQGVIVQRIRGSELFMSPIVFKGYHSGVLQIKHNTFKSDVFSLGMCIFFAACLSYDGPISIREIYDMNTIKKVLNKFLSKRYSPNFINILFTMLQVEEKKRPDFNQLELIFGF